jgi:L-lactate dehydrogenase (cytochrome)
VKALALGARPCLAGRPLVYGLAAGGTRGAARAMACLEQELRLALALLDCPAVARLDESWVASPLRLAEHA